MVRERNHVFRPIFHLYSGLYTFVWLYVKGNIQINLVSWEHLHCHLIFISHSLCLTGCGSMCFIKSIWFHAFSEVFTHKLVRSVGIIWELFLYSVKWLFGHHLENIIVFSHLTTWWTKIMLIIFLLFHSWSIFRSVIFLLFSENFHWRIVENVTVCDRCVSSEYT